MLSRVDTSIPAQVRDEVQSIYLRLFPQGDTGFIPTIFGWAEQFFSGRYDSYQAIDARYHDFEHTLQGTLCLASLLAGRQATGEEPVLAQRDFELGMLAILFHDTGYLKKEGDEEGTGAKYTFTHVERSATFAGDYLVRKGFKSEEITQIQNMIRCTGVATLPDRIPFRREEERLVGYALATADLLGQMAARDYVDKLPVLYLEFAEAFAFSGQDDERLSRYENAEDLMRRTPEFFENYVLPRLDQGFMGLYRYLNDPYPDGPNPYLEGIQANLDRLRRQFDAHGNSAAS